MQCTQQGVFTSSAFVYSCSTYSVKSVRSGEDEKIACNNNQLLSRSLNTYASLFVPLVNISRCSVLFIYIFGKVKTIAFMDSQSFSQMHLSKTAEVKV